MGELNSSLTNMFSCCHMLAGVTNHSFVAPHAWDGKLQSWLPQSLLGSFCLHLASYIAAWWLKPIALQLGFLYGGGLLYPQASQLYFIGVQPLGH